MTLVSRFLLATLLGLAPTVGSAATAPHILAGTPVWAQLPPTPALPKPSRSGFAHVNGIRLWFGEYGIASKGIPVLLLHGGFGNSAYFGHLIPFLEQNGYHVIAVDSRGQGRSTRSSEPYSYHLMAKDVVALLDHLRIRKADIVGWSDGGCIGMDLAIKSPNRVNRVFSFGADATVAGLKEGYDKNPTFAAYLQRVEVEYKNISSTPGKWDEFSAAMLEMWNTEPNFTTDQLRSIRVPFTVADGQYDEGIKPEHNRYLTETIPGSNIVILPNVSHFAMLQRPDEFNEAVLQFLKWR